jgi:transcriptional regulator NrdR family protein
MQCAKCNGKGDVVDSRPQGADIWRRRQCRVCGERWTTVESANPSDAVIMAVVDGLVDATREIADAMTTLKKVKSRGGVG